MSILKKKLFENLVVANVADSRAGLATISDDGSLILVQLTLDFKPNIPRAYLFQLPFVLYCIMFEYALNDFSYDMVCRGGRTCSSV